MKGLMVVVYSIVLFVLQPFACIYLLLRARKQPEYAKHWHERFALYLHQRQHPSPLRIWIHAVSLGETRAAAPLIEALYAQSPQAHVILTHTTPTGRAAGQSLFATYLADGRMSQVYVPYDTYGAVSRFFRTFAPTHIWVMETEVWPNMVATANRLHIPIHLVNGRLSKKSFRQTLSFYWLMGHAYKGFNGICAQTPIDSVRYQKLGVSANRITVTGNLKFDMRPPKPQIEEGRRLKRFIGNRSVVMLASTRDGEESQWLSALKYLKNFFPNVQWWVVPRHPQRFNDVSQLIEQSELFPTPVVRKSMLENLSDGEIQTQLAQTDVVLGDTMGQMFMYYTISDVVMMGGAWLPLGGQNFLEPLSIGKPTLIGPHTFNFGQITVDATKAGALLQCHSMVQGLEIASNLLNNSEQNTLQQHRAEAFCLAHQGAVKRTLSILQP
ncbi:3-deoxy-D-manno-octulosonic acid transferase [Hydromonas duriensis]|uniref:3-deoxy-D-manno-octulosonic acid transferase n=1 Tax=Hydromonas duriensis TaxID=1527608 RepID=A0A4R6Y7I2_9BURK|nr:3-deoxy-D-manno-octulosonic acid transferase [Hydromonas duriensis]TDR31292.1 3-deoxy-D-manno-octulosonic-acid transferase [Hydromonas duriensis]